MAQNLEKIIGNFHKPSTDKHPDGSIGNQQIWENGNQIGSIEFFPNQSENNLDLSLYNTSGDKIFEL